MLKLEAYKKVIVSATVAASVALLAVGCVEDVKPENTSSTKSAKVAIDGGSVYPVVNGKTGPYYAPEQKLAHHLNYGRVPNAAELAAWDTDLQPVSELSPEGHGIPEGQGSVEDGEELYDAKCVMCHGDFGSGGGGYPALSKGNAEEMHETLTNNRWKDPEAPGPVRVFGSYWPEVTTLWWYIRDGMPHPFSDSLTDDEVYALTAYILNINEMSIDGEEVDDDYVLTREKFLKIVMPNVDGFEPNIRGANALPGVRAYFADAKNFGAQNLNQGAVRCMHDCQKATAQVKHIKFGGIKDFTPPMSTVRDLPAKKAEKLDVKKTYTAACAMCHDSYLAPGAPEWSGYTANGMDEVYAKGMKGTEGGMPAKGGTDLSDADFKTMADYLVSGKVK